MAKRHLLGALVAGTVALSGAGPSDASVVFSIADAGGDLSVTYSGSIDLTGIPFFRTASNTGAFGIYGPFRNLASFGAPGFAFGTDDGFGDPFSVAGTAYSTQPYIAVPDGYVFGAPLSGGYTIADVTVATSGLTRGTSVLGTVPSGDTISVSVVPLPPALAAMLAALGLLVALRRRA